jgi:hypothetical protein
LFDFQREIGFIYFRPFTIVVHISAGKFDLESTPVVTGNFEWISRIDFGENTRAIMSVPRVLVPAAKEILGKRFTVKESDRKVI